MLAHAGIIWNYWGHFSPLKNEYMLIFIPLVIIQNNDTQNYSIIKYTLSSQSW
jgi:hypothetical protein